MQRGDCGLGGRTGPNDSTEIPWSKHWMDTEGHHGLCPGEEAIVHVGWEDSLLGEWASGKR